MGYPRLSVALAAVLALGAPAAGSGGSLDRVPRAKAIAAAREVDRLVEADLAANTLKPNPLIDDAGFLRRVYLDLVGRIPSAEEAGRFLSSSAPDKREVLIDQLLASPGYVSHQFNWLADLLRVKSRLNNNVSGEPYIHFIKQSLADNTPWDAFVRELLTASGPAHARGSGATGYYLRDRGMPEDNMSNTIRIFLGTRLECAQCHNHPFDEWTQKQYHEMVAFTGGLQYVDRDLPQSPEGQRIKAMEDAYKTDKNARKENLEVRALRRVFQPLGYGLSGTGTGVYRLPKDYQYDDAKPNDVVKAHAIFGPEVKLAVDAAATATPEKARAKNARPPALRARDINSRDAYARWLTSPENSRFTAVIVNRLWKRLFGAAIYPEVDNFKAGSKPVNAPLEAFLEKAMVENGYDLKQFLRILTYSKTYQREACRTEPSDENPYRFPGPMLRRMSAEQLWDSMVTLVVPNVDATLLAPGAGAEPIYAEYERMLKMPEEEVKQRVAMEVLRTKDPAKYRELQREAAALARAEAKKDDDLRRKTRDLEEKIKAARKKGDEATAKALQGELRSLQPQAMMMPSMKGAYRRGGDNRSLARASDLPQPANPGHFLREFGQSDRDQIEANHTDASVPQALSLLNGFVDKTLLPAKTSAVRLAAAAASAPEEKVRAVFRSLLSRDPATKERDGWTADVRSRGDAAVGDLIWTLVNTREFMFIR